jgi:hypothetical protein
MLEGNSGLINLSHVQGQAGVIGEEYIWCRSLPGFNPAGNHVPPRRDHMKGEPGLILLVEDDPAHAEFIRRNLSVSRIANRLMHVSDGQVALDYLFRRNSVIRRSPPDRP